MARAKRWFGWVVLVAVAVAIAASVFVLRGRFAANPDGGSPSDDAARSAGADGSPPTLAGNPKASGPTAKTDEFAGASTSAGGDLASKGPLRHMTIVGHVVDERRIGVEGADVAWLGEFAA